MGPPGARTRNLRIKSPRVRANDGIRVPIFLRILPPPPAANRCLRFHFASRLMLRDSSAARSGDPGQPRHSHVAPREVARYPISVAQRRSLPTTRLASTSMAGSLPVNELRGAWTQDSLRHAGFIGWVPWSQCPEALTAIPSTAGGVYVISRIDASPPSFLECSAAGRFKGIDPTVALDSLEANWVLGASVVYIGKANHGRLRRRLEEFVGFGRGRPIGHRGGRLIWQLADAEDLLVAWRIMPLDAEPLREETRLRNLFRSAHGKPPFANDPHRLGS